jgi:nucleoside 2-deoxyribosyltransferase
MEKLKVGTRCPMTGWEVVDFDVERYNHIYSIRNRGVTRRIWISDECFEYAGTKKEIIRWLLFKNKFPTINSQIDFSKPEDKLITQRLLDKVISETFIPMTPKEKLDQFLIDLSELFPQLNGVILESELLNFSFLTTKYEMNIFLDYLSEKNFVKIINGSYTEGNTTHAKGNLNIQIKFDGLNHLAELETKNKHSNRCFIAMSFSKKDKIPLIREAIKEVVTNTHHQPILIDEIHLQSDATINDAIIAEIKKSKFVIADFTEQKDGVYFEAGFALGLGLPVIYCCHKKDFKKSHFDLNHYSHIVYKDVEELKTALKNKIEAWIV